MSIMTTQNNDLAPTMRATYESTVQHAAEPALLHGNFGVQGRLNGTSVEFRRFTALPTVKTTLIEGVTPNPSSIAMTKMTAEPEQVGDFVVLSDLLLLTAFDPVLEEVAEAQGNQAGRTYDWRIGQVLSGGTNVQRVNNRASRSLVQSGDLITNGEVKKAVNSLETAGALGFSQLGGRYVGLIHPNTKFDLTADPKWNEITSSNTSDPENRFGGYRVGDMWGVTWYTTNHTVFWEDAGAGAAVDVYSTLILGQGAYGVYTLQDLEYIVHQLGSAGTSDALNQRATSGWKGSFVAKILWDEYMRRIEHAVTQN